MIRGIRELREIGEHGPRVRCSWLVLALLLVVAVLGCAPRGDAGPLWVDPGVVRFDPAHTQARVEIHNRSGTVRPVDGFRLAGEDWGSLRFVDDAFPRTIPGHDSVVVTLELSPASFRSGPTTYRSGHASLNFRSNQLEHEIPIEFIGSDRASTGVGAALLGALLLAALTAALAWQGGRGPRPPAEPRLRAPMALALFGLTLTAAMVPVGLGRCAGRLAVLVGPRELTQCRDGLAGSELVALPTSMGSWWWFIALAVALTALALVRSRPAHTALSGLRLLVFALLLLALTRGLAPADLSTGALVLAQTETTKLVGLTLPRWGLLLQPLGFVLGLALLTTAGPVEPSRDPALRVLERLEQLVWSGLIAAAYLAGPALPWLTQAPIPALSHGLTIAVELAVFAAKIAALAWLAIQARSWLRERALREPQLIHLHARWTFPLALLNLLGVLTWSLL